MELHNAFLDGAGGDQLNAGDRAGLADAVGAVRGLGLGSRVPPRVEMNDCIGPGEVQAGPAGLEGHQHNRDGWGRVERIADPLAVLGRAIEVAVGDVAILEGGLEEFEGGDESREHEHAVPRIFGFFDEFQEGLKFGRICLFHLGIEDARVGTNLPETK